MYILTMTRLDKIKLAIEKGYTCDVNTGKVFGVRGKEVTSKDNKGYKRITLGYNKKRYVLQQHLYIYYIATGKNTDMIDHIDGDRANNAISNLRATDYQQNRFNTKKTKGYSFVSKRNNFRAQIRIDGKLKCLGTYDTESAARQAYLDAKKIHNIN